MSLASGSSGNCYYLGNNEYGLLIDAGIGIRTIKKTLKENSIAFEKIIGLLITHDHADHIKSAGCLGEKYGIPVYTTSDILAGMNRSYCMSEKIYSAGRIIHKEVEFTLRDFVITAFEVPHDGSDNVGYFVRYGNHNFAFATDLGHITERVAGYLCQANYLVIEANYDEEMLQQGSYPYYLKKRITNVPRHISQEFLSCKAKNRRKKCLLISFSCINMSLIYNYRTILFILEY